MVGILRSFQHDLLIFVPFPSCDLLHQLTLALIFVLSHLHHRTVYHILLLFIATWRSWNHFADTKPNKNSDHKEGRKEILFCRLLRLAEDIQDAKSEIVLAAKNREQEEIRITNVGHDHWCDEESMT